MVATSSSISRGSSSRRLRTGTPIILAGTCRALACATAETSPGDTIALLDTGAYTLGEMFQYCGRLWAEAVLVDRRGDVKVIRKRDKPIDLVNVAERAAILDYN
jgi:hypothetical protein